MIVDYLIKEKSYILYTTIKSIIKLLFNYV